MSQQQKALENLRRLEHLDHLLYLTEEADLAEDIADQRRWWVRPINQRRADQGASEQLVQEMMAYDDEEFFCFTRLTIGQFEQLHTLIGPLLIKQNTRKDVLSPYLRLLITLRYTNKFVKQYTKLYA